MYLLSVLALLLSAAPGWAQAQPQTQRLSPRELDQVFELVPLSQPVFLTHAGDGSGRVFVVEQPGRIKVIDANSATDATFLDLRNRVNNGPGEAGLLGLAFHPSYALNGRLFVSYTFGDLTSRISEFHVSGDPDSADVASEQVLLEVAQPAGNHNGGQIDFGPDGMLYVSFGDGGASNDRFGNGQNLTTLLAAILRLDVDRRDDELAYAIPPDNPFAGNDEGWREEIWAWGLRHPWRFSFDRTTGQLWVGDVGQNRQEEIDLIRRGGNYGWNVQEGLECFQATTCDDSSLQAPVLQYGRGDGISVTGGYVYRGRVLCNLHGAYVYADFGSRSIWAIRYNATSAAISDSARIATSPSNVSSFGEDEEGELYIVGYDGRIYRFRPLPGEDPIITAVAETDGETPQAFELEQNYPNPFNSSTTIRFVLPVAATFELEIHDVLGQKVRSLLRTHQAAGQHRITWNGIDDAGRAVAPGAYLYRLTLDGTRRQARSMVLVE